MVSCTRRQLGQAEVDQLGRFLSAHCEALRFRDWSGALAVGALKFDIFCKIRQSRLSW